MDGSGSGGGIFWPLPLGAVGLWRFTLRRFMASEVLPDRRQAGSRAGSLSYNALGSVEGMSQGHAASKARRLTRQARSAWDRCA
jgi:hypothetical protein